MIAMRRLLVLLALSCCGGSRSNFQFQLGSQVVGSDASVTGSIDNAGVLALHDDAWALDITLPGLGSGAWDTLDQGTNGLSIIEQSTGRIFTTRAGGTCQAMLEPHQSSNGSTVRGSFTCSGLTSMDGSEQVDVPNGSFETQIDDAANNPTSWSWPWP